MKTYEVLIAKEWYKVKGIVQPSGWLDWKDNEGCVGLSRPGKWREYKGDLHV